MHEVMVDESQFRGEVKERNKFYKALVEIQRIATDSARTPAVKKIADVCDTALKDIT